MRIPWFKRKTNPVLDRITYTPYISELWAKDTASAMGSAMTKSMDVGIADMADDGRYVQHSAVAECKTCHCLLFKSVAHRVSVEDDYQQAFHEDLYCGACAPEYGFVRVSADNKLRKFFKYRELVPEPGMIEVREDGRPMPKRATTRRRR